MVLGLTSRWMNLFAIIRFKTKLTVPFSVRGWPGLECSSAQLINSGCQLWVVLSFPFSGFQGLLSL